MGIDIREVKLAATGRWYDIYFDLCPSLRDALELTTKKTVHVDCPFCGGENKFRFKKNSPENGACVCTCGSKQQLDVVMAANGLSILEAATLVSRYLFGDNPDESDLQRSKDLGKALRIKREAKDLERSTFLINAINKTYSSGTLITDKDNPELALTWLRANGYKGDGTDIRFHSSLTHHEFKTEHPAFSFLIRDEQGRVVSMQHHYLSDDCIRYAFESGRDYKRQIPYPPSLYPKSVSIRLSPFGEGDLGITEGVRSAFGAHCLFPDIPVWSLVSDYWVKAFEPPKDVKRLYMFYDKDRSEAGLHAADALADRLCTERPEIKLIYKEPPLPLGDRKSVDWFDVFTDSMDIREFSI